MSTSLRRIALLLLLLAIAVQAQVLPADPVEAVARAIQDNYFSAEQGQRIADGLRRDAAAGLLPPASEPERLATALTDRLKPQDRHFRVRWSGAGTGIGTATGSQPGGDVGRRGPGPVPVRRGGLDADDGIRKLERLDDGIGYLSLGQFSHFEFGRGDDPVRMAIDAALDKLRGSQAIVIDLRDNRGGSPHMVGYLVSAFTPPGADIYNTFHSRHGTLHEAPRDWHPSPQLDVPVYVLINGRTGSAAEAFAYTMKNAGRATVVGQPSGGAANPGREFDLGNGYAVFVSTGSPVSPITGGNWERTGVAPNVVATSEAALDVALRLARGGQG